MATSSPVSLTVIDPFITSQPASTYGLLDGTALFSVGGAGTSPSYQWYFATVGGSLVAPVQNITQVSGSIITGATSSTLQIANLQLADPTNFVVIVSNSFGTATSSVASLVGVGTHEQLTFWNFNQTNFPSTLVSPAPWFGVGTASAVGVDQQCPAPRPSPVQWTPVTALVLGLAPPTVHGAPRAIPLAALIKPRACNIWSARWGPRMLLFPINPVYLRPRVIITVCSTAQMEVQPGLIIPPAQLLEAWAAFTLPIPIT